MQQGASVSLHAGDGLPEWHRREDGICESSRPIRQLAEFVGLLRKLSHEPQAPFPIQPVLFRGQRYGRSPLRPRIVRDEHIEYSQQNEEYALREFKRLSLPLLGALPRPSSDLEWLALAQHYGMVTRLLDWTDNALAALWFAMHEVVLPQDDAPAVWVLTPDRESVIDESDRSATTINPFQLDRTLVLCPRYVGDRLRAQSGWFTVHHREPGNGDFPALDAQPEYRQRLRFIPIDSASVASLRRELSDCGVTAFALFPDLGGLCERINERISTWFQQQE